MQGEESLVLSKKYTNTKVAELTGLDLGLVNTEFENINATLDEHTTSLAEIATNITEYPQINGETTSGWINRAISLTNDVGLKNLMLEKNKSYTIQNILIIPDGFNLNLNQSSITIGANVNGIELDTKSNVENGYIYTLTGFTMSVLTFKKGKQIAYGKYKNLNIEGPWDYTYTGTAIDLFCDGVIENMLYNTFENIRICNFEYGIRIRLGNTVDGSGNGAYINANSFLNIRIDQTKKMIEFDGYLWGFNNVYKETSGNIFRNLELQIQGITEYALKVMGTGNSFQGYIWDETKMSSTNKTINCNDKALNNVFDFPTISPIKQNIDTSKNTIRYYPYNYGNPTNLDRQSIPFTYGYPTYSGSQDDYLAFADRRFTVNMITGSEPNSSSKPNMFAPDGKTTFWGGLSAGATIKFEVDCTGKEIPYLHLIGFVFDTAKPKTLKVSVTLTTGEEKILLDVADCQQYFYLIPNPGSHTTKKITVEMTSVGANIGITKIFGVATQQEGQTYVTKWNGKIYDFLDFVTPNTGLKLTSQNGTKYIIRVSDVGVLTVVPN